MNPDIDKLLAYPFERLGKLKSGLEPKTELPPLALTIGEPRHEPPAFVLDALRAHIDGYARYPATRGMESLRDAIADWLMRRFQLPAQALDPARQILPVNGTREGLFAIAQAVVDRTRDPIVAIPNPFYQIYEGAALLAGAEPYYMPRLAANQLMPDLERVDAATWARCQLLYLCSPDNPTGAVANRPFLERTIALAQRYDFVVVADECYSEIYFDEAVPPPGLLQVAADMGLTDFKRLVCFNSLSKRSNLPGMRSGFVAGDAAIIDGLFRYRTYHGCAMPLPHQHASIAAWGDEDHVRQNRAQYREKLDAVTAALQDVLAVERPAGGFNLWLSTPYDDERFVSELYVSENLTLLPGRYLSRAVDGFDPGAGRVRMALVPPRDGCVDAARRIRRFVTGLE